MRFRSTAKVALVMLLGMIPLAGLGGNPNPPEDECARTAHLQTYSDAVFSEETGDVVGFELVIQRNSGGSIAALLYDYEGVPNEDGISIAGQISGRKLTMEGTWTEHLIEEPTKRQIVETHIVRVDGALNSSTFRGTIKIQGLGTPIGVRMKRVNLIWMCKR
jgi:hypothetical protein